MYGVDPDRVSSMYESLTMEVNLSLIIDFHSKSNQTKASKVDYLQKNYIYTTIRLEKTVLLTSLPSSPAEVSVKNKLFIYNLQGSGLKKNILKENL